MLSLAPPLAHPGQACVPVRGQPLSSASRVLQLRDCFSPGRPDSPGFLATKPQSPTTRPEGNSTGVHICSRVMNSWLAQMPSRGSGGFQRLPILSQAWDDQGALTSEFPGAGGAQRARVQPQHPQGPWLSPCPRGVPSPHRRRQNTSEQRNFSGNSQKLETAI